MSGRRKEYSQERTRGLSSRRSRWRQEGEDSRSRSEVRRWRGGEEIRWEGGARQEPLKVSKILGKKKPLSEYIMIVAIS